MATFQITDPGGIALQLTLDGVTVTLSDPKGQVFVFNAQLIPEVMGTLQEIERDYLNGGHDERG